MKGTWHHNFMAGCGSLLWANKSSLWSGIKSWPGQGVYSGRSDVVGSSQVRICHTCIIDVMTRLSTWMCLWSVRLVLSWWWWHNGITVPCNEVPLFPWMPSNHMAPRCGRLIKACCTAGSGEMVLKKKMAANRVYPKNYKYSLLMHRNDHGLQWRSFSKSQELCTWLCFVVVWYWEILSISFRVTSLALGKRLPQCQWSNSE